MANKLPKMAEGMIERVHLRMDPKLPQEAEFRVKSEILRFHTGRSNWPQAIPTSEIPNVTKAADAQRNVLRPRPFTAVFDIDVDGEWHFIGVQ